RTDPRSRPRTRPSSVAPAAGGRGRGRRLLLHVLHLAQRSGEPVQRRLVVRVARRQLVHVVRDGSDLLPGRDRAPALAHVLALVSTYRRWVEPSSSSSVP